MKNEIANSIPKFIETSREYFTGSAGDQSEETAG